MLGFNFLQGSSWAERDLAARYGARTHVVIQETKLAQDLIAQGNRVIFRIWPDDNPVNTDPRKMVTALDLLAPKGCVIQLGNEPVIETKAQAKKLSSWTLTALEEAHKLGRKSIIFNFPVLNPRMELWDELKAPVAVAAANGDYVGFHEYFSDDNYEGIGRCLQVSARFNGYFPSIIVNEFGYSFHFDANAGFRGHITETKYRELCTYLYSQRYHNNHIDVALFSYNNWRGFELEGSSIIGDLMNITREHWQYGTVVQLPLTYVNIRTNKTTSPTNIVGRAKVGFQFKYQLDGDYYKVVWMNRLAFISRQNGKVVIS
jgi:hypothetical protein